ncbi:MAG TPA: lipase family protein [Thermoanaerobaculia bacterium]|nr:lipase family protein [Thermoanaerobaculia bacterium]
MARQKKQVPSRNESTDYWVDLVVHPERNRSEYVNFDHALDADNKFEPNAGGFSPVNAWWLAEASLLAYWLDATEVARIYRQRAGLDCLVLEEGSTLCHLAFNKEFAIVAFRGTQADDWRDLFDDSRFALTDWMNGRVHCGFKAAFLRIQEKLSAALKAHAPGLPVWMTGHSLGAAIAVLAADTIETRGIYTFGLPRVGEPIFVGHFNQRYSGRSFRYVNDHDVVTHVPPGRPVTSYLHIEEARSIDADGHVTTATPPSLQLIRNIFGEARMVFQIVQLLREGKLSLMPDALADHAPVLYATHTWNDLA